MKTTFWDKVKNRLSSDNISKSWKKVRNISGIVATAGGLVSAIPRSIVVLPATLITWVGYMTLVSGVIAGRAQLNTGKEINIPKWLKTGLNLIINLTSKTK
jgi:hypothetical protein